jgi:hypothetical protein
MTGLNGIDIGDMTKADFEGRKRIAALLEFVRAKLPGFQNAVLVDVAPQLGVRQTRLLEGQYVVTKQDVLQRHYFTDTVARGRDYYYPYRSFLPKNVGNLLVAGRHYSSTSDAQKISREIPPCIAMGEAVGVAAAMAIESSIDVDKIDIAGLRARLRAQGADPGDQPAANATLMTAA